MDSFAMINLGRGKTGFEKLLPVERVTFTFSCVTSYFPSTKILTKIWAR